MEYKIEFKISKTDGDRTETIIIVSTEDNLYSFSFTEHDPHTIDIEGRVIDAYCNQYYMSNIQGYSFEEIINSYLENRDLNEDMYWNHD